MADVPAGGGATDSTPVADRSGAQLPSGAPPPAGAGPELLSRIEEAVELALARIERLRSERDSARRSASELDRVLGGMTRGDLGPSALLERIEVLEKENAELHRRLAAGREGIERLLAKIRFLEEQR